ncbi:MAG TPA: hypothetical protein VHJ69_01330 [Gemmatimonadales bacterium]|jgi:hypothetical protein|nr:hypothetical protein [Gemmatimonadales bacterium]
MFRAVPPSDATSPCSEPFVPDVPTIPAVLPLSLFEAVRNLDTPVEDGHETLADEIVARRLGLSNTVAAQIARYRYTADRKGGVGDDELVSVLRLVGRRPDAALVFADAGRRAARYAVQADGRSTRALARASPRFLGRRLSSRAVRRLAAAYFRGEVVPDGTHTTVRMSRPLSMSAMPDGAACGFYGAAYGELFRSLADFEGTLVHEKCEGRGDPECRWRTERAAGYE